jgi:hypothetical protein
VVRAADDGIAYRYVLPGSGAVEVTGERSAFGAPAGTRAWLLPWRPNYENHYEDTPLAAARPRIYGFPALLSVGGGTYALVTESDLALDLGAPARVQDTSWIHPGNVTWSWWSDGSSPRDFERQKQYVDYAWPYVLVDEGWSPDWMPDLVRYASERGVRIIVWSRWDDLERTTTSGT